MSTDFVENNNASRKRLEQLAERLDDEHFTLVTPYGWSVSALFVHMAWWEQRMLVLLRRWQEHGVDESPVDSQAINEALKPLCHAMDHRNAVRLCLDSAAEADAALAAASPELIAQIQASPNHYRFDRSLHRNDHIRDIEALVSQDEASRR